MFKLVSKYKPSGDQPQAIDKLVKGICEEVDYLIILNDKSQPIKRLFMSYKQTGKHGSMIEL